VERLVSVGSKFGSKIQCCVLHARAIEGPRAARQWQHAAELLLAEADVADFSKQIELALFYDGKLVLTA
jgi:hypothetical protein